MQAVGITENMQKKPCVVERVRGIKGRRTFAGAACRKKICDKFRMEDCLDGKDCCANENECNRCRRIAAYFRLRKNSFLFGHKFFLCGQKGARVL